MRKTISLTAGQKQALSLITGLTGANCAALIGAAGTGKTTVVGLAMSELVRIGRTPVLIAPTHRAKQQLTMRKLPRGVPYPDTIARFVGDRPRRFRDEEDFRGGSVERVVYNIEKLRKRRIEPGILILDECSMLQQRHADIIQAASNRLGIPVLMVGDWFQLPPPDENEDGDAEETELRRSQMAWQFTQCPGAMVELTEVVRHDGAILDWCTDVRVNFHHAAAQPYSGPPLEGTDGSVLANLGDDWEKSLVREVAATEQSGSAYESMPRTLCFTNQRCKERTAVIREALNPRHSHLGWQPREMISIPFYTILPSIRERRRLIEDWEVDEGDGRIFSSLDAVVRKATTGPVHIQQEFYYTTEKTGEEKVLSIDFCHEFQFLHISLLNPDGSLFWRGDRLLVCPTFEAKAARVARDRIRAQIKTRPCLDSNQAVWDWYTDNIKALFVDVRSAYCMTIHKSQGSSFESVYVDDDYTRAVDRETRNRLLYVAGSRASKQLYFH